MEVDSMLTEMEAKVLNFLVEEKERYKEKLEGRGRERDISILFQGMVNGIWLCKEKFNLKVSEEFYNECVLYLEETMKEIE